MKKEEQFLKVEIRLADRILEQFKEEAFIVLKIDDVYLPKIKHLLKIQCFEKSEQQSYFIIPGEGIWPYEGPLTPTFYASGQWDPIPLIIGLEKIRTFLEEWNPDDDQELRAME